MKKSLVLILFVFIFYMFVSEALVKSLTIPKDAVRIRIIPNSNSEFDQLIKMKVKDKLESRLYFLLKDAKNSDEARNIINNHLELVKDDVNEVLNEEKYSLGYNVDYGYHYFPSKEYKGVTYDEGYYESLLVTLGKGEGDNWWCVLFPPLCMIEAEENSNVEYRSIVKDILDKYLS